MKFLIINGPNLNLPGQLLGYASFQLPEAVLTLGGEDFGNAPSLTGGDQGVGIHQLPVQPPGEQAAAGGLAAAHHTDKDNVFHFKPPPCPSEHAAPQASL